MKLANPIASLLQQATDRLFASPVDLSHRLKRKPSDTLFRLSTKPEKFGKVRTFDSPEIRQKRLIALLDCARAYILTEHKHAADASAQGDLGIDGDPSP